MATIYELTADYLEVLEMANNPDIPADAIADTLEAVGGEIEMKAENTAKILLELKASAENLKAEEKRLKIKRESIEKNITVIKCRLYMAMKVTGKTKFKTPLFSFSIGKNPKSLVVDFPEKVPAEYLIPQQPKVDNAKLKEDLNNGKVYDFAHLEQSESIRIK